MKKKNTWKHDLLMLAIASTVATIAACSRNNEPEPSPAAVETITITEIRALSTGASVRLPEGRKIKGIVISDAATKNIGANTVVLQEATDRPGIIVTFDASQTFLTGDEVEITASNQTLAQLNGEIVLQNIPTANALKTGTGTIAAREATIADILTNRAAWNGSLVTINATELTSTDSKYTGTLSISDASGTIGSVTLGGATFENNDLPVSVSKITGILRLDGNNVQLNIRNTADVTPGAVTGIITESFEELKDLSGAAISPSHSIPINNFKPDASGNGFLTKVGRWSQIEGLSTPFWLQGDFYDAGFLSAERNYLYLPIGGQSLIGYFDHIASNFPNNAGLRSVAITFAGTTAKAAQFTHPVASQLSFEATDTLAIGVLPVLAHNGNLIGNPAWPTFSFFMNGEELLPEENEVLERLLKISPNVKSVGQWSTFEYILPTKQELLDAGVSEAQADQFIANPQIRIYNRSSIFRKPTPMDFGPIVFDKIVFKYGS